MLPCCTLTTEWRDCAIVSAASLGKLDGWKKVMCARAGSDCTIVSAASLGKLDGWKKVMCARAGSDCTIVSAASLGKLDGWKKVMCASAGSDCKYSVKLQNYRTRKAILFSGSLL